MKLKFFLHFFLIFFLAAFHANATHLRGGEITVSREDCGSLTATITVTVFIDSESEIPFGRGELDFGDGTDPIVIPEQPSFPTDKGSKVRKASFTINYTYASPGKYLITYTEPNRNDFIKNIPNSVQTRFHLETLIAIDPSLGCNNSPILLVPPIDKGCGGVAFFHHPGAYDPDGDSLSYELVIPKSEPGVSISGYVFPDDPSLYANADIPFESANEEQDGQATFTIDPVTGLITWDAPPIIEDNEEGAEYNFAFIVREWRKIFGEWRPLGFVRRDMQVIIEECENEKPELEIPDDICVEAGTLIEEEIFGYDPDKDSVKIEVFSQVLVMEDGQQATYEPENDPFQFIDSTLQGKITFRWQTTCDHVQDQPYKVVFKITDNGSPKLVNFETWNIRVIGPSPEIQPVVNEDRSLRISWDPYLCQNADIMEVWRKVDSNPYEPDSCETGIREEAGYRRIAELPINATSYLDEDLAMGAKYCYRLVAIYEDNIEAESVVSDEQCYEFVAADAPVITNVTVEHTDHDNGEIRVSWKKPFDLDPTVFTGDYVYEIYRATGLTGNKNISLIGTVTNDTTFLDQNLKTEDNAYNYRIVLRVPNGPVGDAPVDTSAVASSVRLEPVPDFNQVQLNWEADVPWSNIIASGEGAYHYIYRGGEGAKTVAELSLIDSVKVAETGLNYLDDGTEGEPLQNDQVYCYAVLTRGTYGNPDIESPLDNLSQITCVQPIDTIAPCTPLFSLEGRDCSTYGSEYGCGFNDFQNEIFWSPDSEFTCQNDIKLYEVYYAATTEDEFVKIAETRDTSYLHTPANKIMALTSFKGCYKIRALDRSGNFSEFSNNFCFDNCPNYELPNVITPGNNDDCNDVFSAFRDENLTDENGNPIFTCGEIDPERCARFVKSVEFIVVNRWGKQVYSYESGGENTIYIDWDGKSSDGVPLPSGVYYYHARVTFDVVDPSEAVQDIKGWVHILR